MEEVQRERPEWVGPPEDILAGVVATQLRLVRTERVGIAVTHIALYPTGVAFRILSVLPPDGPDRSLGQGCAHWMQPQEGRLRVGVLFADGRKAQDICFPFAGEPGWPDADHPILREDGGGGNDRAWHQDYWLWPAPPAGDLVFVAEWLKRDVLETRATIDGALSADARARITPL